MANNGDVKRFFQLNPSKQISFKLPRVNSVQNSSSGGVQNLGDGNTIPDYTLPPRQDFNTDFTINENSKLGIPKVYTPEQIYNYKSEYKRYEKGMKLVEDGKILDDKDNPGDYKILSNNAPKGYWKVKKKSAPPTPETIWGRLDFGIGALDNTPQNDISNVTRQFYTSRYYGYPYSTKQEAIDGIPKYFDSPVLNQVVVYELATEETTYIPAGLKYEYTVTKSASRNDGFNIQYQSELAYFEEDTIISVNANLIPGASTRGIAVGLSKQPNYDFSSTSPDWTVGTYDYLNRGSSSIAIQIPVIGGNSYSIGITMYSQSIFRVGQTITSSGSIIITTPPSRYNNNNGNSNGGNSNGGNSNGGNSNGGNSNGGNSNGDDFECNCPDATKEKYLSPTDTSGNQPAYKEWKDSDAGAVDGNCQHVWGLRILNGLIGNDAGQYPIPTDIPIEIPESTKFPGEHSPQVANQRSGGFKNWRMNKTTKGDKF